MALTSVIDNSNKVPGVYLKVSLGVGPRYGGGDPRYVVLIGNMTSDGTMDVETEYDVFSLDDVRTYAGAGSELFYMTRAALAANATAAIKIIAMTESVGTAATGNFNVNHVATSAGTIGITIGSFPEIEVPFANFDSIDDMASAICTYINYNEDLPVTASVASDIVTCTAKHKGPRGNKIKIRARILEGTGPEVLTSDDTLTGGATSDSVSNVLDTLTSVRRKYLVLPYWSGSQLTAVKTHLDSQDNPDSGNRKYAIFGSVETVGDTTTNVTALNFERMQCAWMPNSDHTPAELAAALAAFRAGAESRDPKHNFNGESVPGLLPHYDTFDIPTNTELQSALNNGITPLTTVNGGNVAIVRSVTCKSQDSGGRPDYRVLDTIKAVIPDEVADGLELIIGDTYAGFNASEDDPEGNPPPTGVLTPAMLKDTIYDYLIAREKEDGWFELGSTEANIDKLIVQLSKTAAGRFNFSCELNIVEWFSQAAGDIRQVG